MVIIMENTITIQVTDNRSGFVYTHPDVDASSSDALLAAILQHIGYEGDESGMMHAAVDFWLQQSQDILEQQIRARYAQEAAAEIEQLRLSFEGV